MKKDVFLSFNNNKNHKKTQLGLGLCGKSFPNKIRWIIEHPNLNHRL